MAYLDITSYWTFCNLKKNKAVETDLQLVKTVELCKKCRAKGYSNQFLRYCLPLQQYSLWSLVLISHSNLLVCVVSTVEYIVCGDTCVLTVATKWVTLMIFPVKFTTLLASYLVSFVVLGWIEIYVDIFHKPCPPGLSHHHKGSPHSQLLRHIPLCC